jgi:hypothetical protein
MVNVEQGLAAPPGEIWSEPTPNGANLYVFNHVNRIWDLVTVSDVPSRQIEDNELIIFEIHPDTLEPEHTTSYAIPKDDAMEVIRNFDHDLEHDIRIWARDHSEIWNALGESGNVLPQDFLDVLPDWSLWDWSNWFNPSLKERFRTFMDGIGNSLAWGKESIEVKVEILPTSSEKHTNNNYSTETILTRTDDSQSGETEGIQLEPWIIIVVIVIVIGLASARVIYKRRRGGW